ncbi:MAG TPA: hypothetical protein VHF67_10110 [Gaiellaceae bacterium]|nr:hypothetical protein [Gaiellaceae bacterium]
MTRHEIPFPHVFNMVVKPTGEDVGMLVFMAAVLADGAAYFGWRARLIGVPAATRGATSAARG